MRKLLTATLCLLSVLLAKADIPAGQVIYLNVNNGWQGAPCYLLHLSRTGMTHVMKATAQAGVYSFTTIASTQDNVNFGKAKRLITADYAGWFGNDVDKNKETTGWTAAKPMWVVDDANGNGHWAAMPSPDRLTDVSYTHEAHCGMPTYTVVVTATLTGSTATLKVEGDVLSSTRLIKKCATPYSLTLQIPYETGSTGHDLTLSACADEAGQTVNNTMSLHIDQPELICEIDSTLEVCDTIGTILLTAQTAGDSIQWKRGTTPISTETTISVPTDRDDLYTAEIYEEYIDPKDNLMVNGDFENGYTGFTSDYLPISKNGRPVINPVHVYSGNYDNGSDYGKYYMITDNASDIQDGVSCSFYPIRAHGGDEFLLVDATNEGYAWKTNTAQSPNLVLTAGQEYIFSYWAAYPNEGAQLADPKAELQFLIELNIGGVKRTAELDTYVVGSETPLYDWHQKTVRWVSPYTCNDVTIGVKDKTTSAEGNDFCLDDIIFQPVKSSQMRLVMTENYNIVSQECKRPTPPTPPGPEPDPCQELVYRKWDNVLFVDNGVNGLNGTARSYQWYADGQPIPGETKQYYYAPMDIRRNYHAVVTLTDGSQVETCDKTFGQTPRSAALNPGGVRSPQLEQVYRISPHVRVVRTIWNNGETEVRKEVRL